MVIFCSDTLVCENLRYLRKKRGISRLALARKVGMPRSLLKMLEESTVPPSVEFERLECICQVLDVTVEDLLHTRLAGDS